MGVPTLVGRAAQSGADLVSGGVSPSADTTARHTEVHAAVFETVKKMELVVIISRIKAVRE